MLSYIKTDALAESSNSMNLVEKYCKRLKHVVGVNRQWEFEVRRESPFLHFLTRCMQLAQPPKKVAYLCQAQKKCK